MRAVSTDWSLTSVPTILKQHREHVHPQRIPKRGVAEEASHVDEDIFLQNTQLIGPYLEEAMVFGQMLHAQQDHAPRDAAADGLRLVEPKVQAGEAAQQQE